MRSAVLPRFRVAFLAILLAGVCLPEEYRPPAGTRSPARRPGAQSILPGGRMIDPAGRHALTGPGPFGLAVSREAKWVVSADGGPNGSSLTLIERNGRRLRSRRISPDRRDEAADQNAWRGVSIGLAFDRDEDNLFVSEGKSGRVRQFKLPAGRELRTYDLNQNGFSESYTGDLAFDEQRQMLYVIDQANFRLVIVDTRRKRIAA